MSAKLRTGPIVARPESASSRAELLRECNDSGATQAELGRRIGTDARGVRRLQRKGRKRADRLDLYLAAKGLGKERRSDEAIGRKTRTRPASVEPLIQVVCSRDAHGGLLTSENGSATAEPLRASMLVAQSSGNRVHTEASSGGESAAEAPVAQPGSAPRDHLGEVGSSNLPGVSVSQQTCSFGNENAGSRSLGNQGAAGLVKRRAA